MSLFEKFKEYQVNDVTTVKEFLEKYYKHDRFTGRNKEIPNYSDRLIRSYEEEFKKYGYCFISHHDSKTGEIVTFYG